MNELGFAHRFEAGTRATTLLLLHGTGGNEHDLIELGRQLAPGANLLSPRGKVLENGAARFFRRLAPGVFDLADLRQQTADLAQFVTTAAQKYQLDPQRVVALGYSNGANIAATLLLLHSQVLAGAALWRPMFTLDAPLPDLSQKSVLLSAGRRDPMIAWPQFEALQQQLSQAGARVEALVQDTGHQLTSADLETTQRWLAAQESL